MQYNLNQRIFFFICFTYLRQCLHCCKFTASNGYRALYNLFFSFQFLKRPFLKIKNLQGTPF